MLPSSSSPKHPNQPRAPAKSTPFSAVASGEGKQNTRSHLQRTAMTTSLRKAKRGQTVARKRHMKLTNSSPLMLGSAMPTTTTTMAQKQQGNPYNIDARHVEETIEVATSIVRVCSSSMMNDESLSSLLSLLERMCVLLTPDDVDANMSPTRGKSTGSSNNNPPAAGASYDSSMAGIAANSLLSKFLEGNPMQTQQQQYSQTKNIAFLLANALAHILKTVATTLDTTRAPAFQTIQIKAAIALNQLAATEPPPPLASAFKQDQFSPYGHPQSSSPSMMIASTPTSWCHVLVQSHALSALVHRLPSSASVHTAGDVELYEKCVGVIGNVAGDSEMARRALQEMVALPRLIGCLSLGISAFQNLDANQSLANLIQNCVWSLTNLFRDGGIPAATFLDIPNPQFSTNQMDLRLTSKDVTILLSAPDVLPSLSDIDGNGMSSKTTWKDIVAETCWFLAFLTKDPVAVEYLCGEIVQDGKSPLISKLVSRLVQDTVAASQQLDTTINTPVQDLGCLIPCCRGLKNMAISCDGRYVTSILTANTYTTAEGVVRPVESSLAKLISFGTLGGGNEASTIASEATATAGACLYDAGLSSPHPATSACRTLLPALSRALVCPLATFEFRREVACALWNAVDLPTELNCNQGNDTAVAVNAEAVQKAILTEIILTSPNEIARALTTMLFTLDSDALNSSLYLIDHFLRRLGSTTQLPKSMPILFEEVGLVDALWHICDNDSDESATAEIAANILDDFYEQEEEDEVDESLGPTSSGGQFQFQVPSTERIPEGGFNFGATAPLQQELNAAPPMGRGRGRGQVLPAWMQRQQLM